MPEQDNINLGQIPFELPIDPSFELDDFLVGNCNERAFEIIRSWPEWPATVAVLSGPMGSGKSHLSNIWRQNTDVLCLNDLDKLDLVERIAGIPHDQALLLEDADRIDVDENILFDVINAAMVEKRWLLITSRQLPHDWGLNKPDIVSRLRMAVPLIIKEPDDQFLEQVLTKLFTDRQLLVSKQVISFVAHRMERSFPEANRIVNLLDQMSLKQNRPVTRQLASGLFIEDEADI